MYDWATCAIINCPSYLKGRRQVSIFEKKGQAVHPNTKNEINFDLMQTLKNINVSNKFCCNLNLGRERNEPDRSNKEN